MHNYLRLAELVTYDRKLVETFNGHESLYIALEQACSEFKSAEYHQKGFACAVVYNILIDKSRGSDLSKYDRFDVDNSINAIYDTKINIEQFKPHDFNYYHCHFDPITLHAEVADDFEDVIASINTKEIILANEGIPLAVAIKKHLLAQGKIEPYDVVTLVMEEDEQNTEDNA